MLCVKGRMYTLCLVSRVVLGSYCVYLVVCVLWRMFNNVSGLGPYCVYLVVCVLWRMFNSNIVSGLERLPRTFVM